MKEYTNIKADDFCCTGAVSETILIRNNYTNYSQYTIIVPGANIITPNYGLKNNNDYLILRNDSILEKGDYAINKNEGNNYHKWFIDFNVTYNIDPSLTFDNTSGYYLTLASNDTLILN